MSEEQHSLYQRPLTAFEKNVLEWIRANPWKTPEDLMNAEDFENEDPDKTNMAIQHLIWHGHVNRDITTYSLIATT